MANRTHRVGLAAIGSAIVLAALAGCIGGAPMPVPTYGPTATGSPSPKPTATPVIRPGQDAEANKPFFDMLNAAYFAQRGIGTGEEIINNLVANGFTKADMEVTPDVTALGIAVDSIVFSVKIKEECLIGQTSGQGYTGVIAPVLGTGKCLIGLTRPIDF